MKCMERNKITFHFATLVSSEMNYSSEGNFDGTFRKTYSTKVKARMSFNQNSRNFTDNPYGIACDCDATLVTDNLNTLIDVDTVLWIGIPTNKPYNYIVTSMKRTLNSVTIGIKAVKND